MGELVFALAQKSAQRVRNALNIHEMGMQESNLTIFFVFRGLRTLSECSLEERAKRSFAEWLGRLACGRDIVEKHVRF